MTNHFARVVVCVVGLASLLAGCSGSPPVPAQAPRLKVGVVIDTGGDNDKGFNEFALKGSRDAAKAAGLDFAYLGQGSTNDYANNIDKLVADNADLIITVGFRMGDATVKSALKYPDRKFAIIDTMFSPGAGCPDTVKDCYTPEGGLSNVTSLMFAEDQVGYLAGVLAACMSQSNKIASVAGMQIPPVVRFVTGFKKGALSIKPNITVLNQYIPDFNDPATGKVTGQSFIAQGADVIFAAGGNTGNGALLATQQAGKMAIGVDVDQYYSYPEVRSVLLTSAMKNVDVAAAKAVQDYAANKLTAGVRISSLENGAVGLAPYHDWDSKVPQDCTDKVKTAEAAIKANPSVTGAK